MPFPYLINSNYSHSICGITGVGPNIESFINDNGLLSHKHELHLNPSDLNNNEQSDESKERKVKDACIKMYFNSSVSKIYGT